MLGVAYKKDVDDPRESPSFVLMELLQAGGAEVELQRPAHPEAAARCGTTTCPTWSSER